MATGKWAGFGEQLGNAIIGGIRAREQREREEALTAEQQRRNSVLEAMQKARLMMEYDQRYRPVEQGDMQGAGTMPISGAPFSLPPQGAVQSKSILGMFGDDSLYMPRTKQEDPYKVYESGYVEQDEQGKPKFIPFDKDGGGKQSGFSLSPGQTRFDEQGKPIASLPDRERDTDPLLGLRRQQLIDEATDKKGRIKQDRIDKYFTEVDELVAPTQRGLQSIKSNDKYISAYVGVKDGKPQVMPQQEWRAKARNSVNKLIKELELGEDITELWRGSKEKAMAQGKNFDALPPEKKREFLLQVIEQSEGDDLNKRALKQYIEIFTR